MRQRFVVPALLLSHFISHIAAAQEQFPLQADLRLRVQYANRRLISFQTGIQGGDAMLRGSVQNLTGGETAFISLHFDYRTQAAIALDELVSQIVISTIDKAGNEFSKVTIDPNSGPLNPNRVPLSYSATVYRPPPMNRDWYIVRIRVFGNYE